MVIVSSKKYKQFVDTTLFNKLVFFEDPTNYALICIVDFGNQKFKLLMGMNEVVIDMDILHYFRYAVSKYTVYFRLNFLRFSNLLCKLASIPLKKWFLNDVLEKPSCQVWAHLIQ